MKKQIHSCTNTQQKYKRLINRECPAFGNTLLGAVLLINLKIMIKIIEWFENASPLYFCLGLIGVAIVIRIIYEIITDK